jgi:catechol 2,3-dioxygenase-like lactoylglutathione lyase family enzyme
MIAPVLRVARPTDDINRLRPFYEAGLGFTELASFVNHQDFDGLILGHPNWPYHLEFTRQHGHAVGRSSSPDNLLVFYLSDLREWELAVARMEMAGFLPVGSYNPYWDVSGRTFEDPDGYRVVLQNTTWGL